MCFCFGYEDRESQIAELYIRLDSEIRLQALECEFMTDNKTVRKRRADYILALRDKARGFSDIPIIKDVWGSLEDLLKTDDPSNVVKVPREFKFSYSDRESQIAELYALMNSEMGILSLNPDLSGDSNKFLRIRIEYLDAIRKQMFKFRDVPIIQDCSSALENTFKRIFDIYNEKKS